MGIFQANQVDFQKSYLKVSGKLMYHEKGIGGNSII
jgi:hypothetical protein